jgi:AcrR family transcriptional regulator
MGAEQFSPARVRLVEKIRQAFLDLGYENMTMTELAGFCGLTRRALYHHFSSKDDAFRAFIRQSGDQSIRDGFAAAQDALAAGKSPLETIVRLFDVRYGNPRRDLSASPHAQEINDTAFRLCRPIMIDQAVDLHARLARMLRDMHKQGILTIKSMVKPERLAQILADGARGANQTLPPVPIEQLPSRYREICAAILFGCATAPPLRSNRNKRAKRA